MIWKGIYSYKARRDLRTIYNYIATDLEVPEIAAGQVQRIMSMAHYLDRMPMRYPVCKEEPWHSKGVHILSA